MKYHDSIEQSAEYLRRALPLMSKHEAALTPITYAVWYEYVSGMNPGLKARIDELTKNDARLDDPATIELFRKYVAEIDEEVARRIAANFQKVLADMAQSAAQAGDKAGQFGDVLQKFTGSASGSAPPSDMSALLKHTQDMQQSVSTLKNRLDESRHEIEELRQEVARAREESLADGLTGLVNRRGFDRALAAALGDPSSQAVGPSLMIADIDHFKRVNDTYGHLFGDKVIRTVARVMKDCVKGRDTVARYGGEEFVVLLPHTPVEGARALAEQIRATVQGCRIKRSDNQEPIGNITISIGVTAYREGESANDFLARADAALYASKEQGRNRVTMGQPDQPVTAPPLRKSA